jgi:ectoine hydrolase
LVVLILSNLSNMAWLNGYEGWYFYVQQSVIVPPEGAPIWCGRSQDANGALRTADVDAGNIIGYPDVYVQSTKGHPMDLRSTTLLDKGWGARAIGVEMDNY